MNYKQDFCFDIFNLLLWGYYLFRFWFFLAINLTIRKIERRNMFGIFLVFFKKNVFFLNSFFPAFITEWNIVDISIHNSSSCHIFENLKFFRPEPSRISSTQNFEDLKLLTRMRFDLSHLVDQISNFLDCLNPICSYGQKIKTANQFFVHCLNYRWARKTFFEKINLIDSNIVQQNDLSITKYLLFGSEKLKDDKKMPY